MYVEVLVITKYVIRQCILMAALPILMLTKISPELCGFFLLFMTCCRLTEMLSCPLEVARQMTLIAHGKMSVCDGCPLGLGLVVARIGDKSTDFSCVSINLLEII